jgi:hypothetical protein
MSSEVKLGKFNPNSKALQTDNNSSKLLHEYIVHAPFSRRDPAKNRRSKQDATGNGQRWLREMKAISQEERKQSIKDEEGGYGEVSDVRPCRFKLVPHVEGRMW